MKNLALLLVVLAPLSAKGADLAIDAKVDGTVVVLTATTPSKEVVWLPTDGLKVIVPPAVLKDSKTLVVTGKPGAYRVIVIAAPAVDTPTWAEKIVVIEGPEPPPGPKPPPPEPDALAFRLKAAYDADASPVKRGQLAHLTGIYASLIDHLEKDDGIKTTKKLAEVLATVKAGMLDSTSLLDFRRILDAELKAAFGVPNERPLDRERAANVFRRLVAAMPRPE